MHKNANKRAAKLVIARETLRKLSDKGLQIVNGGRISVHETQTDEMGQCCLMSRDIPCV